MAGRRRADCDQPVVEPGTRGKHIKRSEQKKKGKRVRLATALGRRRVRDVQNDLPLFLLLLLRDDDRDSCVRAYRSAVGRVKRENLFFHGTIIPVGLWRVLTETPLDKTFFRPYNAGREKHTFSFCI